MVGDGVKDFLSKIVGLPFEDDIAKYTLELQNKWCPKYLPLFERRLKDAGSGWLVGSTMTYPDITLTEVAKWPFGCKLC